MASQVEGAARESGYNIDLGAKQVAQGSRTSQQAYPQAQAMHKSQSEGHVYGATSHSGNDPYGSSDRWQAGGSTAGPGGSAAGGVGGFSGFDDGAENGESSAAYLGCVTASYCMWPCHLVAAFVMVPCVLTFHVLCVCYQVLAGMTGTNLPKAAERALPVQAQQLSSGRLATPQPALHPTTSPTAHLHLRQQRLRMRMTGG